MVLLAFVAKALIYQAQGRTLECLVCLGWFSVANAGLGAAFAGIENYEKQKREIRRAEHWRQEFNRRNEEPEEEEDDE